MRVRQEDWPWCAGHGERAVVVAPFRTARELCLTLDACGGLVGLRMGMRALSGGGKGNRGRDRKRRREDGNGGCRKGRSILLQQITTVRDAFQDGRIAASIAKVWISYGGELHRHKSSP